MTFIYDIVIQLLLFIRAIASLLVVECVLIACFLTGGARGEWYEYQPRGSVNGPNIFKDVTSRSHDSQLRQFANDKPTWTHEATHLVNSDISQQLGGGHRKAFYVGGGRAMVLTEPHCTLRQIAALVPKEFRNSTYKLYLVDKAATRNDEPYCVLDEWTCYTNDAQATRELGLKTDGNYDRARWFCVYADALVAAVQHHDPNYRQSYELLAFVEWQKRRVAQITYGE